VDFGSSDKPLSSDELAAAGLGQFPSAIGGVVPVVNLEGIDSGKLRLDGALRRAGPIRVAERACDPLEDRMSTGGRSTPSPPGGDSCRSQAPQWETSSRA
jgi:hypothetical protein